MRPAVLCIALAFIAAPMLAQAADTLTAQDAAAHVDETATVCGTIVSTNYAVKSKGQPTFLNFDRPYPNQFFTVMIWGSDRAKFGEPESTFFGKKVCVNGVIKAYRGKPKIIATSPTQLTTK
jgi:DNA/RNA endonuclease YhcR with UshA esterase domain